MAPPLSESLLATEEGAVPGPCQRLPGRVRTAAAATALASVALTASVALFSAGTEFGRRTPHEKAAFGVSMRALNRTSGTPTSLESLSLTAKCYGYTGGTCAVKDCNKERNSVCEGIYCVCPPGTCSGPDGVCRHENNRLVASGFTLTNVKYGWQKLYMPALTALGQLTTTASPSAFNNGQDKFSLYELNGKLAGHKEYFLSTERYPDYVAAVRATTGTAFSLFGAYEVALSEELAPDRISVRVCKKDDGQVMIGSSGEDQTEWFYIHHGSWFVYGWGITEDPGAGGYWRPSPPIPTGELVECP